MRSVDDRTPVVVGVGQLTLRCDERDDALDPVAMMVEAAQRAARDSGGAVLPAVDSVRVVHSRSWPAGDPGARVAAALGIRPRQTAMTTAADGSVAGMLLAHTADDIARGALDTALVVGGEAWYSLTKHRRAGTEPPWTVDDGRPTTVIGTPLPVAPELAALRKYLRPGTPLAPVAFALVEDARRRTLGHSAPDHAKHLGRMGERFAAVAATNPNAWDRSGPDAARIATATADNRWVCTPYTKLMCSNEMVDQAAAVLMCSAARARALGIPAERWVFPVAAAEATGPALTRRADLGASAAVRAAGQALWATTGRGPDEADLVDLYSCFPAAVAVQAGELGLDTERDLTVTGGMRFAGGPWHSYPLHAVAVSIEQLRARAGGRALCTANGGFLDRHVATLYATDPPSRPFVWQRAQVEDRDTRHFDPQLRGPATIESWTVAHTKDGPVLGFATCLGAGDRRALVVTSAADDIEAMTTEDLSQRSVIVDVDVDGSFHLE